MKKFDEFRFEGMNARPASNKYLTMNRVSEDGNKIVVKVAENQLIPTKYGYALILDRTHVVFIKSWAVSSNWYGTEVLLTKEYFNVKEWGEHNDFIDDSYNLTWDAWEAVAESQNNDDENTVKWQIAR